MTDTPKASDPRADRLKAALRDNLRRRKAQLRERTGKSVPSDASGPSDEPIPPGDAQDGREPG